MLRKLIGVAALVTAVGWGVAFAIAAPLLAVGWGVLWVAVFVLDFQLWRDTAPALPVVGGEVVADDTTP